MLASSSAAENIIDLNADNHAAHFFHGGHWGQCLELLSHLCQYSDSILLVTGQSGIGKSALKQALKINSADKLTFCTIDATADLNPDNLLQKIESGFDSALATSEPSTVKKHEMVLLIDDAHKLPVESVGVLLQLKQTLGQQRPIHIVLFARPEFESRIQRSPFKDKFNEQVHTIELEPLTLAEVEAFLKHQWQLSGNVGSFPIDKNSCKKIYSMSGGIPGDVQKLAQSYLARDNVGKVMNSRGKFSPFSVGLTVCFGILFCLLAFLWPDADDKIVQATAPLNSEFMQASAESVVVSSPPVGPEIVAMPESSSFTEQMPTPVDSTVIADNSFAPLGEQTGLSGQIPMPENMQPQPMPSVAETPTVHDTDAEKIARLESKLLAMQQQLEKEQEARRAAELKVQAALSNPPASKMSKKSVSSHNQAEKKILSMPGKNYALQILGSGNEQRIKEFIKENNLAGKSHYFKSTYQGRPWYILLYGNYPTREAATKAIELLPAKLKKLQPWPREYAQVQRAIKKKA